MSLPKVLVLPPGADPAPARRKTAGMIAAAGEGDVARIAEAAVAAVVGAAIEEAERSATEGIAAATSLPTTRTIGTIENSAETALEAEALSVEADRTAEVAAEVRVEAEAENAMRDVEEGGRPVPAVPEAHTTTTRGTGGRCHVRPVMLLASESYDNRKRNVTMMHNRVDGMNGCYDEIGVH